MAIADANVPQRCLEQGFVRAVICRNCATDNQQQHLPSNTCVPARRQPHLAEIRRWRRQSVQMGREICVCLSSSSMWQQRRMRTYIIRCGEGRTRSCELANPAQMRQIASQTEVLFLRQMRFVAGRVAGWEAHREAAGRGPGRRCWIQGAEPGKRCFLTAN